MEPVWELPINTEHREAMKSKYADLHNSEKSRYGGASTAAAFIENFIDKDVNWVPLNAPVFSDVAILGGGGQFFSFFSTYVLLRVRFKQLVKVEV